MSDSVNSATPIYVIGSADAILDTAKTVYNEEAERFKQVEAKTSITLAFVGILFGAFLTYLGTFNPVTNDVGYLIYTYLVKFIILSFFALSTIFFFKSITVGEHRQIDLSSIVSFDFAKLDEAQVKLRLASTYQEVVHFNCSKIDLKLKNYKLGLRFMSWSFILFTTHFIIEEIIKHV